MNAEQVYIALEDGNTDKVLGPGRRRRGFYRPAPGLSTIRLEDNDGGE